MGRTLLSKPSGRAFCSSDTSPLLAPTPFNAGKREERGDASFVNNTIKGSLICQKNVPAPVISSNTAESIEGSAQPDLQRGRK